MAYGRAWRKEVMVMAAADDSRLVPGLYQLLGVPLEASGEEITRAWRRRAAAEHPDRQPRDAAAPARFRALLEAYQVLGDPSRRAAYDRSLGDGPEPAAAAPEGPAAVVPVVVRRAARVPEPPLRAGPVRVEVPGTVPAACSPTAADDMVRLAALVRYLAGDRGRPW